MISMGKKSFVSSLFFMRQLLMLGAVLIGIPLSSCATLYHAEAIEGWVVDAETGKPLEGVIIVAHWEIKHGISSVPIAQVQILETVTDRNGRYFFPAWGPKTISTTGYMGGNSPRILLFKPGYKSAGFTNVYSETYGTSTFFYNRKTLKLERFNGALSEYARDLDRLSDSLFGLGYRHGDPCNWKSFPKMLAALDRQESEFRRAGVVQGTVISELEAVDSQLRAAGCGSVNEFLTKQ